MSSTTGNIDEASSVNINICSDSGNIEERRRLFRIHDAHFSWTDAQHEEELVMEWSQLPLKSIIAIVPARGSEVSNDQDILYVADKPSPDRNNQQGSMQLKSLEVVGLPPSFVQRFQPSKVLLGQDRADLLRDTSELHVVVSTGSGTGQALTLWEQLVRPSLQAIWGQESRYRLHSTTSESSITELIETTILPQANKGVAQSILLLSGDGGVVDIVNALLSGEQSESYKKPVIALLPAGTGNALANSTVVGNDDTIGLRTMFRGSRKEVPLFRATFSPGARLLVNEGSEERQLDGVLDSMPVAHGAVVCSWGLHATLVADSDTTEYRKYGAERFKMAGKEALFPSDGSLPHAYKGRVSILRSGKDEWEAIPRDEHGYILATLVSSLEAGFTISPSSRPLDGKLRLVHFGHVSGEKAMEIMSKAYQGGKHAEDEKVGYDEIQGLRIQFDEEDGRWRRVCVDGKIIRVEKDGWVEVRMGVKGVIDLISRDD